MDERTTLLVRTHLDSLSLVDEYQKLQAENEWLKGENAMLNEEREKLKETIRQCDSFTLDFYKGLCKRLAKENAKLECLALHAMSEYFGYKTLFSKKKKLRTKYGQFANKFHFAYLKAKKELKEGK